MRRTKGTVTRPPNYLQTLIAFAAAPPAAGLIVSGMMAMVAGSADSGQVGGILMAGIAIGSLIGWPTTLFVAWPLHRWLYRTGRRELAHYVLASPICAIVDYIAIVSGFVAVGRELGPRTFVDVWWLALLLSAGAFFSALVFWLIRRPDRDAALTSPPSPQTGAS
jgi:hypothetical protein